MRAAHFLPYLGAALYRLTFIECEDVPTFGVDEHWRVYCNPKFTRQCFDDKTVIGGVIHEVLHPTLHHKKRAQVIGATDHAHANVCEDCEINHRIDEARIKVQGFPETIALPPCGVHARDFGWQPGLMWEEYYKLPRPEKKEDDKPEDKPCSGGSGATGQKAPWEKPGDAPGGVSEAEGEIIRAQVAEAIRKHVEAKGRGSVPAGLLRWAEEFGEPPPVPWHDLVAAQVRYQIEARRGPAPSYARPSRREWDSMSLPVHRLPTSNVCIVGDTSASMTSEGADSDLSKVIATVWDAVETLGKVSAIGCDSDASEVVEVRHIDDLREALSGGGGTDMRVGLAKAAESNPDVIVCVTDGDTLWPHEAPDDIPVVVVLTRDPGNCEAPPSYAQVIFADEAA